MKLKMNSKSFFVRNLPLSAANPDFQLQLWPPTSAKTPTTSYSLRRENLLLLLTSP